MNTPRIPIPLIAVILGSLSALGQPTAGEVAATVQARPRAFALQRSARVAERLRLVPAAGSAAEFESFTVDVLDDGTRVVRGAHRLADREDHSRYRWTADLVAGTYRVERIPLTSQEIRDLRAGGGREIETNEGTPNNCEDPKDDLCTDRCSGNWTATVTSYDPFNIELTRTTVRGSWAVYGISTCLWRESYSGTCWANPLTSFNTTWFVDSCTRSGSAVQGAYHNDDFGLDSLRTYTSTYVVIRRVAGFGTFVEWTSVYSGEGAPLLHGALTESGTDGCW